MDLVVSRYGDSSCLGEETMRFCEELTAVRGVFLYEKGLLDRCRFMTCLYSEMPLFLRVATNCA